MSARKRLVRNQPREGSGVTSMFEKSRRKLARAMKHIEELERVTENYKNSNFCELTLEKTSEGKDLVRLKITRPAPEEIPLIIVGAPSVRNKLTTATGSVADINAPNTRASFQLKPGARCNAFKSGPSVSAISTVEASTPGTARDSIVSQLSRSWRKRRWNAASNSNPGRKTENSSSFVRCGA